MYDNHVHDNDHDEDNYITLLNLAQNLYYIYKLTIKEKFSEEIRTYTIQFLGAIFDRLGWDSKKNEKHTDALLRSFVITALGKLGDDDILAEAKRRFAKFLKKCYSITVPVSKKTQLKKLIYRCLLPDLVNFLPQLL